MGVASSLIGVMQKSGVPINEEWAIQVHIDFGLNNPGPNALSGTWYACDDLVEHELVAGFNGACGTSPYWSIQLANSSLGGTPIAGGQSWYDIFRRGQAIVGGLVGASEILHYRKGMATAPTYTSFVNVIHVANFSLWRRPTNSGPWTQVGVEIQKTGLGYGPGWSAGAPVNRCTTNPIAWGANSPWVIAEIPTGTLV